MGKARLSLEGSTLIPVLRVCYRALSRLGDVTSGLWHMGNGVIAFRLNSK